MSARARGRLTARPTTYRGVQMRSRLEAHAAEWFDRAGVPWRYEPGCFADQRGQYLPDFALDGFGVAGRVARPIYVEVKPTWEQADVARARMEIIWSSEPAADLCVLAPPHPTRGDGYLAFALGGHVPADPPDMYGTPRHRWLPQDWGHAGCWCLCGACGQVSLTIWADYWACARCGTYGKPTPGRGPLDSLPGTPAPTTARPVTGGWNRRADHVAGMHGILNRIQHDLETGQLSDPVGAFTWAVRSTAELVAHGAPAEFFGLLGELGRVIGVPPATVGAVLALEGVR